MRQVVVEAVNSEVERLPALFLRALQAIDGALDARVIRVGTNGAQVDLGPDHPARLAAVGALIKLMTAARPVPKAVA